MPADGQTAKFLYTILKQLDLKSVSVGPTVRMSFFADDAGRLESGGVAAGHLQRPRRPHALLALPPAHGRHSHRASRPET